jgi:hypothetical protein
LKDDVTTTTTSQSCTTPAVSGLSHLYRYVSSVLGKNAAVIVRCCIDVQKYNVRVWSRHDM